MVSRAVQLLKTALPIEVICAGNVTVVSWVQERNAQLPTRVTLSGSCRLVSPSQQPNA